MPRRPSRTLALLYLLSGCVVAADAPTDHARERHRVQQECRDEGAAVGLRGPELAVFVDDCVHDLLAVQFPDSLQLDP